MTLTDLQKDVPIQSKFVSYKYAVSVNKGSLGDNKASKLLHKAVRKAVKTMLIPRDRLQKIGAITRYNEAEIDTTHPATQVEPQQIEPQYEVVVEDVEGNVVRTMKDLTTLYNAKKEKHAQECAKLFEKYPNFREDSDTLNALYIELERV